MSGQSDSVVQVAKAALDLRLLAQDTASADLRRIVVEVSGQALTLTGGNAFALDGFVLQGTGGPSLTTRLGARLP